MAMASSVLPVRSSGKIAAAEQLQKLNGEFDVADAAMAGFDVSQIGAFRFHVLLDASLEGFDAGDVGAA